MSLELAATLRGSPIVRAVAVDIGTAIASQAVQGIAGVAWRKRSKSTREAMELGVGDADLQMSQPAEKPGRVERQSRSTLEALPGAEIVSSVPGRIRIKVHGLRSNHERAAAIQERMTERRGTLSAEASALTGSVLVRYDESKIDETAIVEALDGRHPARRPRSLRQPASPRRGLRLVRVSA